MDSDDEITEDFDELVARGRNRTCRRRASQHDSHYISVDEPSFISANGSPGTPSQDEQWWVSSFIEDSDEDSSSAASPVATSPVATSPQVCALPTSQVVPDEGDDAASLNQDNVASTDSDSSSSASSPISFAPASAALPLFPDDGASADSASLPMVNFNRGAPALPFDEDNVASTDSDSSSSASSPISFAPASAALPLFPAGGASDSTDLASLPAVNLNQSASALPPVAVGEASDYTDIAFLPMVNLSQSASVLQPAAVCGAPADSDFPPSPTVPHSPVPQLTVGGADTDFPPLPMVSFNRGAPASPSAAVPRQRNLILGRIPRAPFHRRARRARRALSFASPIARRPPRTPPAVQAAASSIQQSVCGAPADTNLTPLPTVPYSPPRQVSVRGAPADTDFAPLPTVPYSPPRQVSAGGASAYTDFAPLPVVNFNRGAPALPSAADGGADTDFAPLPMVSFNRGAPALPSAAVCGAPADTDFAPLPTVPYSPPRQVSASTMASQAVSLQPTRSALPPGAIPKRRNAFARAPFQQRPRRARRAMSFAPPTASRPPRNLPDELSAAGRRNILQATASRSQQSDAEKSHHVIGEIAFQLDRRILSYIFVDHPRLYGFRIADINERINEVTGRGRQRDEMLARNTEIMNTLRHYGYCPVNHSTFSEFIVNTYGILRGKPQCQKMLENYNNRDYLYKLIVENTPPALLSNMLVLLNSLWHLSVADGQPMFIW